jgi:shikimate kinase
VVATGGGVILDPGNLENMRASGLVVCLEADEDVILDRVARHAHRPLLEMGDKAARIRELLATRRPIYDSLEPRMNTGTLTVDQCVRRVIELFRAAADRTP